MYRIYGYDDCPYCRRAKNLLEFMGLPHEFHEVPEADRAEFLTERGFTGRDRTFPRIYWNDDLVGGYDQLELKVLADA